MAVNGVKMENKVIIVYFENFYFSISNLNLPLMYCEISGLSYENK